LDRKQDKMIDKILNVFLFVFFVISLIYSIVFKMDGDVQNATYFLVNAVLMAIMRTGTIKE
jgi:hypothetical protein